MENEDLELITLYQEDLAFSVPIDHAITQKHSVNLDILQEVPSVLLPDTYFMRQLINEKCHKLGFDPQPVMEMTTMESIINMISDGVGVTILPNAYFKFIDHKIIHTVTIENSALNKQIVLVYRKII